MKLHAEQFAAAGIPFIFDPGQGMTLFNGEELAGSSVATWVAANDYEASLLASAPAAAPSRSPRRCAR